MKSLHDRAIAYVAALPYIDGHRNFDVRILGLDRSFIPDVQGKHDSLHEVEVMKHKFTVSFARKYEDAIKEGLPRKRNFVELWLVIPNYDGMARAFDALHVIAETKEGLVQLFLGSLEKAKQDKKKGGE